MRVIELEMVVSMVQESQSEKLGTVRLYRGQSVRPGSQTGRG